MRKDPQNLKVRVVMKPTATLKAPGQYRYNWARVALITVPLLLVIGLLAAKFLFNEPSAPPSTVIALDASVDAALGTTDNANDAQAREPSPPLPAVADIEDAIVEEEVVADEAEAGEISFISNPKYAPEAVATQASAVIVSNDWKTESPAA